MKVRPEDKNKVILLLVAIIAIVVWIVVFIVPQLKSIGSPPANQASTTPTSGGTPVVSGGNVANPGTVQGAPPQMQIASGTMQGAPEFPAIEPGMGMPPRAQKDPFKPVIEKKTTTAPPPPKPAQRTRPPISYGNGGQVVGAGWSGGGLPLGSGGGNGQVTPIVVLPPPVPLIELKGVTGTVAVIAVGGNKKFAGVGDVISDGVKVRKIREDGIELTVRGKSQVLGVGRTIGGEPAPTATTTQPQLNQQPPINPSTPYNPGTSNGQPMTKLDNTAAKAVLQTASVTTEEKPKPVRRKRLRRRSVSASPSYRFSGRRL
jgi:hypothetical protein